jgi:hypothetical protein
MRVLKNKSFARFAKKAEIEDVTLCDAVQDADRGLIAADLGGGLIKQRVARRGEGKSGGFRTLIVFKQGERAFFVHRFAKNEQDKQDNITMKELVALRKLASKLLAYNGSRD